MNKTSLELQGVSADTLMDWAAMQQLGVALWALHDEVEQYQKNEPLDPEPAEVN